MCRSCRTSFNLCRSCDGGLTHTTNEICGTHVSIFVDVVVGQLEFLEGQRLRGELAARQRRVWMPVDLTAGVRWVRFTGDHPRRPVISVAVSLAVDRDDVEQDRVLGVDVDSGSAETDPQRREHPSIQQHNAPLL